MKDYLQQAAVTAPKVILGQLPAVLVLDSLRAIVREGNNLDVIKKHMFYGKEIEGEVVVPDKVRCSDLPAFLRGVGTADSNIAGVEIIHGVIGAITETVELAEALLDSVTNDKPIDVVNLAEECGDVIWYLACILRHGGKDFPALMEQNIAKLRKRYPDGFTTYDAMNRDLSEERQVLEQIPVPEGYAPASKPVVELHRAMCTYEREAGEKPRVRMLGHAQGHPTLGTGQVNTSRVLKFDYENDLYETRNTIYKVISWL